VAAYVRRTKINISPFAQSMAAGVLGIANPIVQKLISPEALSELLGRGWPVTVGSDPPPGTVGITERTIGTVWQLFKNSEYGFARFEVSAPSVLPRQQRFRLTFRLLQWRWRLVAVTLPENIQNLLGDELAKPCERQCQTSDGRSSPALWFAFPAAGGGSSSSPQP
jgi:hypothetical protein